MYVLKKLTFAPFYLLMSVLVFWHLEPIISDPYFLFSIDIVNHLQILTFCALVLAAAFFYVMFVALAQDLKIVLPVVFLASFSCLLFFLNLIGFIMALGSFILLSLVSLQLIHKFHTYISFHPVSLLSGSAKLFMVVIILLATASLNIISFDRIKQKGVEIPEFLIDLPIIIITSVCSLVPGGASPLSNLDSISTLVTPEQIGLLKSNPQVLQQLGLDPKMLDQFTASKTPSSAPKSQDLVKKTVSQTLISTLNPYKNFIPYFISTSFFFYLLPLCLFFTFLLYPVWLITFWVLNKSGFTHYETEVREIKKLVI